MSIKERAIKEGNINYIEGEYKEVYVDDKGKEYYKEPVSSSLILKIIPVVHVILGIFLSAILCFEHPLISILILIICITTFKPIRRQIILKLLKTNRFFDNTTE